MVNAAIFDMDGTLLDSQWIWTDLGARYLRSKGLTPEAGLNEILAPLSMEQGCRYLISTYSLPLSIPQVALEINQIVADFYENDAQLKPNAKEFLIFLHSQGVRLCVVTATDRSLAEAALERCGVLALLDFLLTVDQFGLGKDQPDIFLYAMERLGGRLDTTLVFEDAPHAIRTAQAAGFSVIGIQDPTAGDPANIRPLCRDYWTEFPPAERIVDTWPYLSSCKKEAKKQF